jgi:hypothetical protein
MDNRLFLKHTGEYNYLLISRNNNSESIIASSNADDFFEMRLSKKNCNDIFEFTDINDLAEQWVFEKNGHKWSNNDDSAGDNFGSFKAGCEIIMEINKNKIISEFQLSLALIEMSRFIISQELRDAYDNNMVAFNLKRDIFINKLKDKIIKRIFEIEVEIKIDFCGDKVYSVPEYELDDDDCLILVKK